MKNLLYRFVSAGLQHFIWGGEIAGEENLPEKGPAVLVANHLGALGPIAAAASVPRRLYPWVISAMMDAKLAPEYLRWDFVERELHLARPFSLWLAALIAKISVPLMNQLECIPVYPDSNGLQITFERSVDVLVREGFLLVFPEDPNRPMDERLKMTPFKKGFVRLGELYFQRTRKVLRFYPLAVHDGMRVVQIGKPIAYNPYAPPVNERIRIKNVLEKMIHEMYLELDGNAYVGVPLPH